MDLWIRSQDKEELVCVHNRIFINNATGIGYQIKIDFLIDEFIVLGTYETEERALEVLDEIEEIIETQIGKKTECLGFGYYSNTVYEMPME